jgi:lysophospholipase L1-like esterase
MTPRIHRALAAFALGLSTAAAAQAQTNFTTYIAIGDSLAAGYSSGALVETNQATSVPALIARQASIADFQQPLISEPGIPIQLGLVSLVPTVIAPKATTQGVPKNLGLARPYNNLAVPGASAGDALSKTTDNGGLHDVILRGRGSQVAQAAGSRPTFVTLWIGNNDVLAAAVRGTAVDGVTLTPTPVFRQVYTNIIATLKATGASILAANLPDVTTIPYVTTIKPYVVNPSTGQPVLANGNTVPLIGPNGPLAPGTYVTLAASSLLTRGIGIPTSAGGNGQALPDEVILDANEVAVIRAHAERPVCPCWTCTRC